MSLSVRVRRVIVRAALAADVALAAAIAISAAFPGHHSWAAGFSAFTFLSVSVITGLLYLRSTRGRQ